MSKFSGLHQLTSVVTRKISLSAASLVTMPSEVTKIGFIAVLARAIICMEVKKLISGVCIQIMVKHGHNTVRPVSFLPTLANGMLPTKQLFPSLLDNAKQLYSVWHFEVQGSYFSHPPFAEPFVAAGR